MIVLSQLALKTHTNLGCAASFATLDKLVDKFTLPPAALPKVLDQHTTYRGNAIPFLARVDCKIRL
jgi:hypothetical protein